VLDGSVGDVIEAGMSALFLRAAGGMLAALALAQPAPAQEKVFTLKELVDLCKSSEAERQSACNGFITGVRHTLVVFKNSLKDRVNYCIPPAVNNREFRNGVMDWAGRNPNEHRYAAVRGVIKSAFERYPCGKSAPKPFEF
jgi:hypothetical protein